MIMPAGKSIIPVKVKVREHWALLLEDGDKMGWLHFDEDVTELYPVGSHYP